MTLHVVGFEKSYTRARMGGVVEERVTTRHASWEGDHRGRPATTAPEAAGHQLTRPGQAQLEAAAELGAEHERLTPGVSLSLTFGCASRRFCSQVIGIASLFEPKGRTKGQKPTVTVESPTIPWWVS